MFIKLTAGVLSNQASPSKLVPFPVEITRTMPADYRHLLAPGRIGAMELRNRLVLASMGSNFAEPDGTCNERTIAYYEARARGVEIEVNRDPGLTLADIEIVMAEELGD